MSRLRHLGVLLPAVSLRDAPDGMHFVDDGDGRTTTRMRTEQAVPASPRCLCSHTKSKHTRGAGQCWSTVCGCSSYRPEATR